MFARSLEDFHRWRVTSAGRGAPPIIIQTTPDSPRLAGPVGRYLNEFHEDADGRWTAFSDELLGQLSLSAPEKALLGVKDGCINCPAGSACSQRRVHAALAGFGYVVLEGPMAVAASREMKEVFRVAVGTFPEGTEDVHLVIQPGRFPERMLPALIGDTYLEWETARELADNV